MNTQKSVILANGENLVVRMFVNDEKTLSYRAYCSSDSHNDGFEGDRGPVKEGETLDSITDELEMWLNDNISDAQYADRVREFGEQVNSLDVEND